MARPTRAAPTAGGIALGELPLDAAVTPTGDFIIHPLYLKSQYGLPGPVDVKVGLLYLTCGLDFSFEAGIVQSDSVHLSVEPLAIVVWNSDIASIVAGNLRASFGSETAFNVSAGYQSLLFDGALPHGSRHQDVRGIAGPLHRVRRCLRLRGCRPAPVYGIR